MIKKKNNNLFYFCSTFYFYIRFREWQNLDLSIFLLLIFTYFNSKSTVGGIYIQQEKPCNQGFFGICSTFGLPMDIKDIIL